MSLASASVARAVALVLHLPPHPKVQYTGLLIAGRYASWLSTEDGQQALPGVMQLITNALQQPETVAAAAVALQNVCQDW